MFISVEPINLFILTDPWRKWYNVWEYLKENFSYWIDNLAVGADAFDKGSNRSWSSGWEPKHPKSWKGPWEGPGSGKKTFCTSGVLKRGFEERGKEIWRRTRRKKRGEGREDRSGVGVGIEESSGGKVVGAGRSTASLFQGFKDSLSWKNLKGSSTQTFMCTL